MVPLENGTVPERTASCRSVGLYVSLITEEFDHVIHIHPTRGQTELLWWIDDSDVVPPPHAFAFDFDDDSNNLN